MMRVVNLWKEMNWYVLEDQSSRWRDWHEAVGVMQGVYSRDKVRHSNIFVVSVMPCGWSL